METDRYHLALHAACGWAARLAWLNILWLAATLGGGVVVGLFPATAGLFGVLRRWLTDPDSRTESTAAAFWRLTRPELARANAAGYGALAVVALLVLDLRLAAAQGGPLAAPLFLTAVAGCALAAMTLAHLPFVYVHLKAPLRTLVRTSWWYALSHPAGTLVILTAWAAASLVMGRYPALAFFFGASAVSALTVLLDLRGFAAATATGSRLREHSAAGGAG